MTARPCIEGCKVTDTPEGPVWSSRAVWDGESSTPIGEAIADSQGDAETRTATQEAADWLADFLDRMAEGGRSGQLCGPSKGHVQVLEARSPWAVLAPPGVGDVPRNHQGGHSRQGCQGLYQQGGSDDSATIKREGAKADHSKDALKRARRRVGATVESSGFPREAAPTEVPLYDEDGKWSGGVL